MTTRPCEFCVYWEEDCTHMIEDDLFNWEEQDFMENRLFYENNLERLEELPTKEKHR